MAFSESSFSLFVIIKIRTLDMVFKFKNFFDSPFLCVKTFLNPPIYKGKTLFALPPIYQPPPINNDHSLNGISCGKGGGVGG
jgi:hypothetical protein